MVDLKTISSTQKSRYLNIAKQACIVFAGIALTQGFLPLAGTMIIVAEIINIVKESYDIQ